MPVIEISSLEHPGVEIFCTLTEAQLRRQTESGKGLFIADYTVSYCHLSRVLTAKGTVVRPRDAVGITGSTGRSTGEHLHITCKLNGKSVDPSVVFDYIRTTQQECISALSRLL